MPTSAKHLLLIAHKSISVGFLNTTQDLS